MAAAGGPAAAEHSVVGMEVSGWTEAQQQARSSSSRLRECGQAERAAGSVTTETAARGPSQVKLGGRRR